MEGRSGPSQICSGISPIPCEKLSRARKYGEACKVTIRKARHDALDMLSQIDSEGAASADEVDRAKKKAEDLVADAGKQVDQMIAHKEKDILEV